MGAPTTRKRLPSSGSPMRPSNAPISWRGARPASTSTRSTARPQPGPSWPRCARPTPGPARRCGSDGSGRRRPPLPQVHADGDVYALRRACSVAERHRAGAGELHQRRSTLELSVLDELAVLELALVEADRAYVEAPALLDELLVEPRGGRVLVGPDPVGVAPEPKPNTLRGQPEHHLPALVQRRTGGQIGRRDGVGVLLAAGATHDDPCVVCHPIPPLLAVCERRNARHTVLAHRV